jgi:tetratricopeptide (TPR) repeat protein
VPPEPSATAPPAEPGLDDATTGRDLRRVVLHPRVAALLVTEIQGLEALLGATALEAPDRPQLLRRIAADYVELEHAGAPEAVRRKASQRAISTYRKLVDDGRADPRGDEVLYYLGLEYEHAGDAMNARRIFFEVIQKFPSSRYIPHAYLAFGEMFFEEASSDPSKWELARQAYLKVVEFPPRQNDVYGYASYKLALALRNAGDTEHAAIAARHAVAFAAERPDLAGARVIAARAESELGLTAGLPASGPLAPRTLDERAPAAE